MAELADPTDAVFQSSRAALMASFPDLVAVLDALGTPRSRIVGSRAGNDLNLDLGHTTLYGTGAELFAATQIEAFRRQPNRFYMEPPPRHLPPHQEQYFVTEALYAHAAELQRAGIEITSSPADRTAGDGGYAVIYGIGLGLHLPELFEEARARHFVLVEEHAEFLLHALRLNNWAAMLDGLESRGQTLHFVIGQDSSIVSARVHWYLRGRGFGLLDGSYLFRHYSSTLLDYAYADFVKKLPLLPVSIGFVEDEFTMLRQGTLNLVRSDFRLLDLKPRLEKELPAIIVGSGPSLDRTIEDLRRLAPNAIIFSAGTSLLPLLRNGIRPDFHCELENSWSSVEHLQRVAAEFDLDGITLLGSNTIHPWMPPMFRERVLYFRDSVCSTPLWCPDGSGIHGTAPTCTNLALRAALVMAFRKIYLFGVDLGTRRAATYHSKGTIYGDDQSWAVQETNPVKLMNIPLPGNFGGGAWTNQILHWARMMMAQTIEAFSTSEIYNCSDGVAIPGTVPRLAGTVTSSAPNALREVVLNRLTREMKYVPARTMATPERMKQLRDALARYYRAMQGDIAKALEESWDFLTFYERTQPYLERTGAEPLQAVLRSINVGTLMMCFQVGYYFWRRVPEACQAGVMQVFLTSLHERLGCIAGRIDALIADMLTEMEDQPATVASISQSTT